MRAAVGRLNRPRVYRARTGIGRGLKQVGGIGLVVPTRISSIRAFGAPTAEERFLDALGLTGTTVYDVGAFRGVTAMYFARRTGATGRVIAFEPHPVSCDYIRRHLELNRITNVTVFNVAVGADAGELDLLGPAEGDGTTSGSERVQRELGDGPDIERRIVPLVRLDQELDSGRLPAPDFVKIDVELMELDVLRGMQRTIDRHKPQLFVEIHGVGPEGKRENVAGVAALLDDHGYSMHHVESDTVVTRSDYGRALEGHLYCE